MRFFLTNDLHDNVELNLTAGLIIKEDHEVTIRAKTLLVLKYLIIHKDQIVTKQALLNEVWPDVVVQEQVLVQSIKEIRDLLGSNVIKTYSRQGYQWVADINEIPADKAFNNNIKVISIFLLSAIIFLAIYLYLDKNQTSKTGATDSKKFKVAFLPVKNDMPDDIHDWVPLEGMDYLSQRLKQQSHLSLADNSTLIQLVNTQKKSIATDIPLTSFLRKNLGADLIVQTRLLGYPQDFQLHYTLFLPHSIERGIEFADNVEKAFEQLVQKVALRFDQFTPILNKPYVSDFSNEAFTLGIEHYLKREYQQATSYFSSALQSNNNLLAARRYLAASYINGGNTEQGISLMKENILQAQLKQNHREEMRSNLMIGVLLINWYEKRKNNAVSLIDAEHYIKTTKTLAKQHQDLLFSAYSHEELAKIKRLQKRYDQAILLLNEAIALHQEFRGDYGQTRPLIELALVASEQGNHQQAESYFSQATVIAINHGVTTNKVDILLAQAQVHNKNGENEKAKTSIQQALTLAHQEKSDLLIARIEAWLDNNNHYEIN
jgi:DNA-binding winged helix-turn-helix (wHTH) protein/Tfp pilus assembly protein PilF